MKPISELPVAVARRLRGVLFDIDDTVLDHGRLSTASLAALHRTRAEGLLTVGVTGRPVAWGQVLVRQWPVDAMITENGALWAVESGRRVRVVDRLSEPERERRRESLLTLVGELRRRFPDVMPADDASSRLSDYTFDIGETVTVPSDRVAEVASFARSRGARVTRSSIHLHVTYDAEDKATGVLRYLSSVHGIDPTASRHLFAFIGDSENDAPCFAAFDTTVGVANFRGRPSVPPKYITHGRMGAGFAEFVDHVLRGRAAPL